MKAAIIEHYGPAEVLHLTEIPTPRPDSNDVLIRLIASSINPIDIKIRAGYLKEMLPLKFPLTLGWDGAGIVESVGSDVTSFKAGDAVYAQSEFTRGGTYAEYVLVDASQVAFKPKTLSFAQAAAIPMGGQAAWAAVISTANIQPGQSVLIHGAAGALGSIAVQLAKWKGAYVFATASGSDRGLVESFGADEVIDYQTTNFKDIVQDLDAVIATVPGPSQEDSYGVLKPGGILVTTAAPPSAEKVKAAGIRAQMIFTTPSGAVLAQLADLADRGIVRAIVGTEFSLGDVRRAHELCESGKAKGKIILHNGQP